MPTQGTEVHIGWSQQENGFGAPVWPFDYMPVTDASDITERFREIIEGFALFNPHATFRLNWFGAQSEWKATDRAWEKWKPNKPTSCHWYEQRHLERLIGAYITHDAAKKTDRLVSDLVAEFDGLTGSQKRTKVLDAAGMKRMRLPEFVRDDRLDSPRVAELLAAMQRFTRPVKPYRLGLIGENHFRTRLLGMGIVPESFTYEKKLSKDGVPCVLESAFGWRGEESIDNRKIYAGANWSAAIKNPFRSFGTTGEGLEAALTEMRAGAHQPIVFAIHLACPRLEYSDRGKSALIIGGSAA